MCIESKAQKARASVVGSISELLQGRVAHREFKYKHSNSNANLALCQCDKHKPSQRRLVGCDSPKWGFFCVSQESQDLNAEICSSPTVGSKPLTLMGLASRTLDPAPHLNLTSPATSGQSSKYSLNTYMQALCPAALLYVSVMWSLCHLEMVERKNRQYCDREPFQLHCVSF